MLIRKIILTISSHETKLDVVEFMAVIYYSIEIITDIFSRVFGIKFCRKFKTYESKVK